MQRGNGDQKDEYNLPYHRAAGHKKIPGFSVDRISVLLGFIPDENKPPGLVIKRIPIK